MNYHNISYPDQNNGDGLRVVLWLSGCPHHCKNCQNSQTWDKHSGILFDNEAKKEIFEELSKDYINGITFSGGEPLAPYNYLEVRLFMKEIKNKFPDKTIWLYTGYSYEELTREQYRTIIYVDYLVDGKFVEELKDLSLPFRGSSNQRIINVQKTLEQGDIVLWEDEQ